MKKRPPLWYRINKRFFAKSGGQFIFVSDWKKHEVPDDMDKLSQHGIRRVGKSIDFQIRIRYFEVFRLYFSWNPPNEEFRFAVLGLRFEIEPFFGEWEEKSIAMGLLPQRQEKV